MKISIGIPAYNSEKNINSLVRNLMLQIVRKNKLVEIIIYSDNSQDKTVEEIKKIKDSKKLIKLINASRRKGMAYGLKHMLKVFKGDVFILLNDDIKIKDKYLLNKLCRKFTNKNIGIVSGNPQPIHVSTLLQRACESTFRAYEKIRYSIKNGNNKHTCDGKVLALNSKFVTQLKFPDDHKMGNVDAYLYFSCITSGFQYRHCKNAKVYFSFPSTFVEYIKWSSRNNSGRHMLGKTFGEEIVRLEYRVPFVDYIKSVSTEFLKNPLGTTLIYLIGIYCKLNAIKIAQNFTPTWDVSTTTKNSL